MNRSSFFTKFSQWASSQAGRPSAFILAFTIVLVWGITGPIFGFSDTWQLVINTGTTIVTFLMVFLIQNSQNRDTRALEIKLDELLRVTKGAHLILLDIEELDEQVLQRIQQNYEKIAQDARRDLKNGVTSTGSPEVQLDL